MCRELPQTCTSCKASTFCSAHPGHGKFGGSQFRYDAAVGGQIPIITLLQALGEREVAGLWQKWIGTGQTSRSLEPRLFDN